MSLPINIEELITQRVVESNRIEYKAEWNPEPIIHSITAFANDIDNMGGGYIIIGIEEQEGKPALPIAGLNPDSVDRIQKAILNKCNLIEPRYLPIVEPVKYAGVNILVIWAPGGDDRPYKCPEHIYTEKGRTKSEKQYYIRKVSSTVKANSRDLRDLFDMAQTVPFDDRMNPHAEIKDMRGSLMAEFLDSVGSELYEESLSRSVEQVATDMRLIKGPHEYRKPVNVGLMFFSDMPERFFPYARIEVVDKPDPTGIGMTEKIFTGPIDKQLRDALAYIKNYIIKEYVTKIPDRAEAVRVYNWPYTAVEEALSNAVYHKSYQIHEPITVTVTPEMLDILSLPGPDRSITDEDIEKKIMISSRYRNRRIGDFLKELKMVEGRNTGIPLIIKTMEQNGSEQPMFITDEGRSFFRVQLPIHPVFREEQSGGHDKNISRTTANKSTPEIETTVHELVEKYGCVSMKDVAEYLGYKKPTEKIRRIVNAMVEEGKVKYLYPKSMNSPKQGICRPDYNN